MTKLLYDKDANITSKPKVAIYNVKKKR